MFSVKFRTTTFVFTGLSGLSFLWRLGGLNDRDLERDLPTKRPAFLFPLTIARLATLGGVELLRVRFLRAGGGVELALRLLLKLDELLLLLTLVLDLLLRLKTGETLDPAEDELRRRTELRLDTERDRDEDDDDFLLALFRAADGFGAIF